MSETRNSLINLYHTQFNHNLRIETGVLYYANGIVVDRKNTDFDVSEAGTKFLAIPDKIWYN